MAISGIEFRALARHVEVTGSELIVDLADGRRIAAPLAWFPRLAEGPAEERSRWELLGDGEGIHWPGLDEDLSVAGLLAGSPGSAGQHSGAA